ncbi:MAG: hypothetical protein AVDCRST_MAG80-1601 [uncultured Rubrobacteraceae bacterium]|uniref:Transporter suffix domain-containing protein n=1 Tax=uncultured Rubrobacteraceae bacterium TaxID=349277 RepID=A0A6J4QGY2_9ACTN|nr:MAG: hypothetical protein AVDCRST_MAG80-1601 [uncultured Rubrobacteraceae bacterium]
MNGPGDPNSPRSERAEEEPGVTSEPGKGWRIWALIFGVFVVPGVLYLTLLAVPFLPLTTGQKVWVASGLVVAAEGTFLLSALLLGREAVRRYRGFLNPRRWFAKRPC